ncbi:MAG: hypothetical protein KC766_28060 [Myxococcales bacterium]|nr:hypothetical protein [Myxococcales bacterium]
MSEETIAATSEPVEPGVETQASKASEWLELGKNKLGGALHWLAQTLTRASAGLSLAAAKVEAAGASLAVTE